MKKVSPVSVPLVAACSALVQGSLAVLFVPFFAFLLAVRGGPNATGRATLEGEMIVAVIAPFFCAAFGFVLGTALACVFNMCVPGEKPSPIVVDDKSAVRLVPVNEAVLAND
jgi:hypothetical protein